MKDWLRCPHSRKIQIRNISGLVFFEHDGGEWCELLNDYGTTVDQIMNGEEYKNSDYSGLVFAHSEEVRDAYFSQLSTLTNQKLNDAIRDFVVQHIDERCWATIYDHAIRTFGTVLIDNLDIIATDLIRVPEEDARKARAVKPKYAMQNLKGTKYDKMEDRVATIRAGLLAFDRDKAWLKK